MRLQRLTALESDKVRDEHAELMERIGELRAILGDEARIDAVIGEELADSIERYGDERRTEITHFEGEVDIEDMIADQQMVISLTASGYAKRLPLATYRQQHRGGKGVTGMDLKEGDYIEHLHICSTHDFLLFFTNRGKVYRLKVYELPEGSRTSRGKALVNVLPLRDGEKVMAVIPTRDFSEGKYLAFATAEGPDQEDRVPGLQHADPRRRDHRDQGPRRRRARPGPADHGRRRHPDGLPVRQGLAVHRGEGPVDGPRHLRRAGDERLRQGRRVANRVLAMDIARHDTEVFVVTENGYGKRTPVEEYPVKGRGTKGILTAKLTEKKGGLAGALIVREHQDLLFISVNGMVQRTRAGDLADGPRDPGRQGDEHQGRRPRQRRRPRRRRRRLRDETTQPTHRRRRPNAIPAPSSRQAAAARRGSAASPLARRRGPSTPRRSRPRRTVAEVSASRSRLLSSLVGCEDRLVGRTQSGLGQLV